MAKFQLAISGAILCISTLACSNSQQQSTVQTTDSELILVKRERDSLLQQVQILQSEKTDAGQKPIVEKEQITEKIPDTAKSPVIVRTGKHNLTLQWISWDKPGSVVITNAADGKYLVKGEQRIGKEYVTIDGTFTASDEKTLVFNGTIKSLAEGINSNKVCVRSGEQIFKTTGNRKYWRLQNMINCEGGLVTDYIDIYF